ncbi:MAG TPA: tripartite tricarboxylate transporter TctB family protein [Kiloniellales bacterium]|jgi:putative tricarboxylic transport membrane protein|nr:tripartite tricarboxylate transporter TctB family protein [Kiloniellales bacterium]
MRFNDLMLGSMLLLFAVVLGAYSFTFPPIPGQRFGAALFPQVIALGLGGCALTLLLQSWRRARANPPAPRTPLISRTEWTLKPGAIAAVFLTIGLVVLYILFSEKIGFLLSISAILIILFRLLHVPWSSTLAATLVGSILLDFVFRSLLLVPLPFGILPRLPW